MSGVIITDTENTKTVKLTAYQKPKRHSLNKIAEKAMSGVFFVSACVSIAAVVLICAFMFVKGCPAIAEIGAGEFLLELNGSRRIQTPASGSFL